MDDKMHPKLLKRMLNVQHPEIFDESTWSEEKKKTFYTVRALEGGDFKVITNEIIGQVFDHVCQKHGFKTDDKGKIIEEVKAIMFNSDMDDYI